MYFGGCSTWRTVCCEENTVGQVDGAVHFCVSYLGNRLVRYSLYSTLFCWQVFKIHRVMPSFFFGMLFRVRIFHHPSRWHNCRNVLVTSLEICGALCSRFYFGTLPCRFSPFLRLFGNRIRKQRLLMPSTRGFKEDNYRDLETVCWKTRTRHLHPSTFKVVYLYVRLRVIICVV